ncbi:MAG: hypothetical protein ACLQDQ_02725 [Myxococcaceae bacterium]
MRAALLWGACAALGCGGAPVTTQTQLDPTARFAAVVLEPVRGAALEETPALGQRLTAVVLSAVSGEVPVWAPAEVQMLHLEKRDWSANTAVPLLRAAGIRPEQTLLVRARIDTGAASSQQEVQGAAGSAVGATAELRWRARVEVLQPSTGQLLVETTAEARADPLAGGGTEAARLQPAGVLERAAAEAFARLGGSWTPPRAPKGPLLSTWTVVASADSRPAHALDAEVQRLQLLQTANPGLDETEAARLARLPPGVLVREAPLGFRLKGGDEVLSLGALLANAAALARCRFATAPVALEVRGADGLLRRVKLP